MQSSEVCWQFYGWTTGIRVGDGTGYEGGVSAFLSLGKEERMRPKEKWIWEGLGWRARQCCSAVWCSCPKALQATSAQPVTQPCPWCVAACVTAWAVLYLVSLRDSLYNFQEKKKIAFPLYQMVSSRSNWKDWYLVKISLLLATSSADFVGLGGYQVFTSHKSLL